METQPSLNPSRPSWWHSHESPHATSLDSDATQTAANVSKHKEYMLSSMIANITSWVVKSRIAYWWCLVLFEIIFVPATWNHGKKQHINQSLSPRSNVEHVSPMWCVRPVLTLVPQTCWRRLSDLCIYTSIWNSAKTCRNSLHWVS